MLKCHRGRLVHNTSVSDRSYIRLGDLFAGFSSLSTHSCCSQRSAVWQLGAKKWGPEEEDKYIILQAMRHFKYSNICFARFVLRNRSVSPPGGTRNVTVTLSACRETLTTVTCELRSSTRQDERLRLVSWSSAHFAQNSHSWEIQLCCV